MSTIRLSDHQSIDLSRLLETRLLIQANSGGGKSWCIRRLLEQSHGKVQQLVIDPEGEFSSLREKYDYVLAARHGGDTAADPRIAKLLAERLLELGVSAILDIYELKATERVRFVRFFIEALIDAPKKLWHPALVVLDEAHIYCPQQGEAESAAAVKDLATRGRKRGYCAILATQRLSKLHKDAAAECNNKLIGRTGLDVDVRRAADELGFSKERWGDLRRLKEGRFFGFGPAVSMEVVELHVGPVVTSHPEVGRRIAATPPAPTAKIKALLPKLADLPAEAQERQKTTDDLKKELQSLRGQLAAAQRAQPETKIEVKEVPVVLAQTVEDLRAVVDPLVKALAKLNGNHSTPSLRGGPSKGVMPLCRSPRTTTRIDVPKRRTEGGAPASPSDISRSQQRILDALYWLEAIGVTPASKSQVALMAGQSPTSGGYFNNLGRLRASGHVDYPAPSQLALSQLGHLRVEREGSAQNTPHSTEELHQQVLESLPKSQAAILAVLVEVHPRSLTKGELAERVGQSPTSGGYFNNLGRLRTLGMIEYPAPGVAIASEILFLDQGR